MRIYRIDHVAIDETNGEPYHTSMHVVAWSKEEARVVGRNRDPRLSPGAEITDVTNSRKFYLTFHVGVGSVSACRTLGGHRERLLQLKEFEAARKKHAPTHWGKTDDWYAAETSAIETLLGDIVLGFVPPVHVLERE